MSRLKEQLEQLAPRLVEQPTVDYSKLPELTDEERETVPLEARKQKFAKEEQDKYNREYWEKLTNVKKAKNFTATELRNMLILSKTASGKRFVIDKDNEAQVNTLCLYFSGDPLLEEYGFSHSKALFLMGPLGTGKSHLMSFFIQNQKASYVMAPCRQIENIWNNSTKDDLDIIKYHSQTIIGSLNTNPYGHQQLGVCFDDLGTETIPSKRFGEEKNVMAEIILARYDRVQQEMRNEVPALLFSHTHFTSNLNKEKIITLYGDRVNDRLKESCNVIVFPNDAKSRRA